jgi:hypothetical protein
MQRTYYLFLDYYNEKQSFMKQKEYSYFPMQNLENI